MHSFSTTKVTAASDSCLNQILKTYHNILSSSRSPLVLNFASKVLFPHVLFVVTTFSGFLRTVWYGADCSASLCTNPLKPCAVPSVALQFSCPFHGATS